MSIHSAFTVHKLNGGGLARAKQLAEKFSELAAFIDSVAPASSREKSLAMTKLEEASFFAKKAMAINPENQESQS